MPQTLTSLFSTLMTSEDISVALQQRMFHTAVKEGDNGLLTKLAAHPSLDASVDELIKAVPTAAVRAAWIARPGRTADDISEMVTKERRITVLTALAEHAAVSDAVQRALVEQTKNVSVLIALATNPNASKENRRLAADRVIELLPAPSGEMLVEKNLSSVRSLRDGLPGYFETIAQQSESLYVLMIAAESLPLESEAQNRLIDGYLTVFSGELDKQPTSRYGYGSAAQHQLVGLIQRIAESSELSDDNRRKLDSVCSAIQNLMHKDNYGRREFDHLREILKSSNAATYSLTLERIAQVTSTEELDDFITWFATLNRNSKVTLSSQFQHSIAARIVAFDFSTREQIKAIHDWYGWGTIEDLIKLTSDPRKQAALVEAQRFYVDYDDVMSVVEDKQAFIDAAIEVATENHDHYIISQLMELPEFTTANLRKVPLKLLVELELNIEQTKMVSAMLAAAASDDQMWSVLESLSDEYEGSLDQLLELAGTI